MRLVVSGEGGTLGSTIVNRLLSRAVSDCACAGLSLEGALADRVCLGVGGAVTAPVIMCREMGTLLKRDTLLLTGRMMYRACPSRHMEDGTTAGGGVPF